MYFSRSLWYMHKVVSKIQLDTFANMLMGVVAVILYNMQSYRCARIC